MTAGCGVRPIVKPVPEETWNTGPAVIYSSGTTLTSSLYSRCASWWARARIWTGIASLAGIDDALMTVRPRGPGPDLDPGRRRTDVCGLELVLDCGPREDGSEVILRLCPKQHRTRSLPAGWSYDRLGDCPPFVCRRRLWFVNHVGRSVRRRGSRLAVMLNQLVSNPLHRGLRASRPKKGGQNRGGSPRSNTVDSHLFS
jgi:hypothetical protein